MALSFISCQNLDLAFFASSEAGRAGRIPPWLREYQALTRGTAVRGDDVTLRGHYACSYITKVQSPCVQNPKKLCNHWSLPGIVLVTQISMSVNPGRELG